MASINRDSVVLPWLQLAAILREQIKSGRISGRLPSGKALMREYGLADHTVRKARALLREEGIIETEPGWGTYVRRLSGQ